MGRLKGFGADPAQAVGSSPFGDTVMQVGGDVALVSPSIITTVTIGATPVAGITKIDMTTAHAGEATFMGFGSLGALPTGAQWFIKVIYTDVDGITHTKFANSGSSGLVFNDYRTFTYTY